MQGMTSHDLRSCQAGKMPLAVRQGVTDTAAGTRALGVQLGRRAAAGDVIACCGPVGAGKTTLIQGFAEGLGVGEEAYVRSPTFILMHEYHGRLPLYHFDFYRLSQASEVYDLGFEEYCDAGGVVMIEWAEKFPEVLPAHRLELVLRMVSTHSRVIRCMIYGDVYGRYLEAAIEGFEAP